MTQMGEILQVLGEKLSNRQNCEHLNSNEENLSISFKTLKHQFKILMIETDEKLFAFTANKTTKTNKFLNAMHFQPLLWQFTVN